MKLSDLIMRLDAVEEGDGWIAHCPSHEDSHPSLRIAEGDGGRILLKCRAGCETADVLNALELTFADIEGDGTPAQPRHTKAEVPPVEALAAVGALLDRWAGSLTTEAIEYAQRRFGLSEADCHRLGLGYTDELGGGPRLVVPFRDRLGRPVGGYQGRALQAGATVRWLGPHNPEGGQWAPVAWLPSNTGWAQVLLTEGPGDGLTAAAAGYDAIAVRGAALAKSPRTVNAIVELLDGRPAVVAGDGDQAGRGFTSALVTALAARGIDARALAVPDGEDLTSWREQDPEQFRSRLIEAVQTAAAAETTEALLLERDPEHYSLTDVGQAEFVRDYIAARGSGVKYTPESGFLLLDNGVWSLDNLNRVRAYVQEAAARTMEIAKSLPENTVREQEYKEMWKRFARSTRTTKRISDVITELKALRDVAISIEEFDQHHDLLAARNGVIDLRTGKLLPHDPSLLLTKRVEYDYDPEAKAPRWRQFIREVLPQEGMADFIQRLIGYGITGRTSEQCFAILFGVGANGKSKFTDTLTEVFRQITQPTPFSTLEAKPGGGGATSELVALRGARLVVASEGEAGRPMSESTIKHLTGQDRIAARQIYKEQQTFKPTFLLLMSTNHKPVFKGVDTGLWRRVKMIEWNRVFEEHERDYHLEEKLLAEGQGILTWAVEGAIEWYARGLQEPELVKQATANYRQSSDALSGFCPGVYVIDRNSDAFVSRADLWNAYIEWADAEHLQPREVWQRRTFLRGIEERGAIPVKRSHERGFRGIRRAREDEEE